jgi:hypothetical protein
MVRAGDGMINSKPDSQKTLKSAGSAKENALKSRLEKEEQAAPDGALQEKNTKLAAGKRSVRARVLRTNVAAGVGLAELLAKARPGDVVVAESGARHAKLCARGAKGIEIKGEAGGWRLDALELVECEDVRFVEAWIGAGLAGASEADQVQEWLGLAPTSISLVDSVAIFERCVARVEEPEAFELELREASRARAKKGGAVGEAPSKAESNADADAEEDSEALPKTGERVDKSADEAASIAFCMVLSGSSMQWSGAIGTELHPCELTMSGASGVAKFANASFFGRARVGSDSVLRAEDSSWVFMTGVKPSDADSGLAQRLEQGLSVDGRSEVSMNRCQAQLKACRARISEQSHWRMEQGSFFVGPSTEMAGACVEVEDGSVVSAADSAWSSLWSDWGVMVEATKSRIEIAGGSYEGGRVLAKLEQGAVGVFDSLGLPSRAGERRLSALWRVQSGGSLEARGMGISQKVLAATAGSSAKLVKCVIKGMADEGALDEEAVAAATLGGGESLWEECVFAMGGSGVVLDISGGAVARVSSGSSSDLDIFAKVEGGRLELSDIQLSQARKSHSPLVKGRKAHVELKRVRVSSSRLADSELMLNQSHLATSAVDWTEAGRCPVHMRGGSWQSDGDIQGAGRARMGFLGEGATSNLSPDLVGPAQGGVVIRTDVASGIGLEQALRAARSGDVVEVEDKLAHGMVELKNRHGIRIQGVGGRRFALGSLRLKNSVDIELRGAHVGEGSTDREQAPLWLEGSHARLEGVWVAGGPHGKGGEWPKGVFMSASEVEAKDCAWGSKEGGLDVELREKSVLRVTDSSTVGVVSLSDQSKVDWVGGHVTAREDKKRVWRIREGSEIKFARVEFAVEDDYVKVEGAGSKLEFEHCAIKMSISEGKTPNAPFWVLDQGALMAKQGSWTSKGLPKSSMIFCDREAQADIDGGRVVHDGPVMHVKNKSSGRARLDSIERESSGQFAFLSKQGARLVVRKTELRIGSQGYAGQGGEIEFEDCQIEPVKTGLMCVVKAEEGGVARWTRCGFKNSHEPLGYFQDAVGRFEGCVGEGVAQWMLSAGDKGSSLTAVDCQISQTRSVKPALVSLKRGSLTLKKTSIATGGGSEADVVTELTDIDSQQCDYIRGGSPVFSLSKGSLKSTADRFERKTGRVVLLLDGATSNLPQSLDEVALADIEARLEKLPGLGPFKAFLGGAISQARVAMARKKPVDFPLRVILEGPSGSGKTTAAEILGQAARACGAIAVAGLHIIDDVVMDDLNQRSSRGKPLLLRRPMAHRILDGQSARSLAVEGGSTLVMISASADEMVEFETKFPSLAAVFKTRVRFEACVEPDLLSMFEAQARVEGFEFGEGALKKAGSYMKKLSGAAQGNTKNGWAFKAAWAQGKEAQAKRLALNRGELPWDRIEGLDLMLEQDIPDHAEALGAKSVEGLIAELEAMTGLADVKSMVSKFVALTQANKRRGVAGAAGNLHLVFSGNPGTGKTTVARLMGDLYRELGLLPSGHVIETDRSGLVGEYIGHTAARTKAMAEKAMGGVLFIDEAYALTRDTSSGRDFGAEAVDTLIKIMEDKRRDFAVVMAGYPELMDAFMESNPGLKSRVGKVVRFEDYALGELVEMLMALCQKEGFKLGMGVESAARVWISSRKREGGRAIGFFNQKEPAWGAERRAQVEPVGAERRIPVKKAQQAPASNFGNAREIRRLFDHMLEAQAQRLAADQQADAWEFVAQDVPPAEEAGGL